MMSIDRSFATFALVALVANCGTPSATEGERPKPDTPEPVAAPTAAAATPAPLAKEDVGEPAVRVPVDGLPAFGAPGAPVTIVAVGNHQCPYCARSHRRLDALRAEYGDKVRLVVVPHALPMHARAEPAARALFAAVEQGKGDEMDRALYAKDGALSDDDLRDAARSVGLDLAAFDSARNGPSTLAALRRSEEVAALTASEGTPTTFVNGRRLVGARRIEAFRALVDEELAKAQAMIARGVPRDGVYAAIMANAPVAQKKVVVEDKPVTIDVGGAPIHGDPRAPVTVALFSDFECPYCVKLEATLRELEAARPGKVKIAFKHRPLAMHPNARLAARGAVAAERQNRFWEYHDVLVQNRIALDRASLVGYAERADLSVSRFERDLDDASLDARVDADVKQAEALDVKGTPTVFVNGRRITGAQPLATFLAEVDRAASIR